LTTAYNDAAGRTPIPSGPFLNPGAGNLGGLNLVPGLYKFTGTALITGSDVTLTGGPDDVWIFQIADDLEVGSTIHVILGGGAQARNIFWQVGTSAVIGTFAVFKGTIIADQAITINSTGAMDGRALAFSAGVTFNGDIGALPTPTAPVFAGISKTSTNVVVVLNTTPYFLVTLQSSPSLSPVNWTTVATNTPVASPWTFTNNVGPASQRFYRAFITSP
jgi:Ice-binding-like